MTQDQIPQSTTHYKPQSEFEKVKEFTNQDIEVLTLLFKNLRIFILALSHYICSRRTWGLCFTRSWLNV